MTAGYLCELANIGKFIKVCLGLRFSGILCRCALGFRKLGKGLLHLSTARGLSFFKLNFEADSYYFGVFSKELTYPNISFKLIFAFWLYWS